MDLKQQLTDYGCGSEFIEIALGYAQFYQPDHDLEVFIEYVEAEYAKVEEVEDLKKRMKRSSNRPILQRH